MAASSIVHMVIAARDVLVKNKIPEDTFTLDGAGEGASPVGWMLSYWAAEYRKEKRLVKNCNC